DKEFEGDDGSTRPRDHAEMERPHAKPITGSPPSSTAGVQRAADEKPGAEVCPRGPPGVPAGRGALLRQEAIASREDSGVPAGEESPPKVLEKGGSQPELLGPGGGRATERVPPRSWSAETAPAAVGKAGRAAVGEKQADSSIKIEICPWEESGGPGRAPGKGGSERDPQRLGEEPEKPLAKMPELLKAASEKAESVEGRRAEVCPWETGEKERTARAEICPWDTVLALDKGSSRRGSPRPKEGTEPPGTEKHPALPGTSPKQAGSVDSRKADVCPWEVEDKPIAKTEICPWEEPAAPPGKERRSPDTRGTPKEGNKPASGGLEDIKAKLAAMGGRRPE
ncbi:GP179 protein, partial [Trogon melanurus]|nr:GP179 protein [Trogon melanurus]